MPALQPPSMQIGAPMPGNNTLTTNTAGPSLAYGFNTQPALLQQQVVGNSSAAAPASFTLSGITATKAGSFLVLLVSCALSGAPTISTPANWTAVAGAGGTSPGNTLAGRCFVLPNNAGGITSVAITTLAGVNGIAVWFGEFLNVYATDTSYGAPGAGTYSNGTTTPSATSYTPVIGPTLLVGMESDVTGQAYTAANIGTGWVAGTTATSTSGATNTIIRPFFLLQTTPEPQLAFQIAGTLAGSIAAGAAMLSVAQALTGPYSQPVPQAAQQMPGGAMAAWGPLGNTKPGGAGSGQ